MSAPTFETYREGRGRRRSFHAIWRIRSKRVDTLALIVALPYIKPGHESWGDHGNRYSTWQAFGFCLVLDNERPMSVGQRGVW